MLLDIWGRADIQASFDGSVSTYMSVYNTSNAVVLTGDLLAFNIMCMPLLFIEHINISFLHAIMM